MEDRRIIEAISMSTPSGLGKGRLKLVDAKESIVQKEMTAPHVPGLALLALRGVANECSRSDNYGQS